MWGFWLCAYRTLVALVEGQRMARLYKRCVVIHEHRTFLKCLHMSITDLASCGISHSSSIDMKRETEVATCYYMQASVPCVSHQNSFVRSCIWLLKNLVIADAFSRIVFFWWPFDDTHEHIKTKTNRLRTMLAHSLSPRHAHPNKLLEHSKVLYTHHKKTWEDKIQICDMNFIA